jgi:hypothetical protein
MTNPLKVGGFVVAALLGATAMGVALLLANDPGLLKKLVKQGALTYQRALTLLAETKEQLGDIMAEALQEAEEELRSSRASVTGGDQDTRGDSRQA